MTHNHRNVNTATATVVLWALLSSPIASALIQPRATLGFESVTGCHLHGETQYCFGPEQTEFRVVADATATATATAGLPSSYTDCHNHDTATYCIDASGGEVQLVEENQEAPSTTAHDAASITAGPSVTAVTACHLDSSSLYCESDGTEYYVQTTVTATTALPSEFSSCHNHDDDIFCLTEDSEVAVIPADQIASGEADPDERNCHFHAGVEHCVGGDGEEEQSCDRVDRDYKMGIRIGMLFVVLVSSSIGVFGPILIARFVPVKANIVFTVLKQFGTGIIISTAFVHLFTHAFLMFGNSCLGELEYEATTAAIVMAGLFISFLIEFLVHRAIRWQTSKHKNATSEVKLFPRGIDNSQLAIVSIMEAGIIFHSILIGVTLVVAGDSFFVTLAIVIIFHQLFEGIALGTRIASLGYSATPQDLDSAANPPETGQQEMHSKSHRMPAILASSVDRSGPSSVSLTRKLLMGAGYAVTTPVGMAIGIGVLHHFNGNNKSTIIAIGTLDALSAGVLIWVGLVDMWAGDWMLGGELTDASALTTGLALFGLVAGMLLMSVLGKWA